MPTTTATGEGPGTQTSGLDTTDGNPTTATTGTDPVEDDTIYEIQDGTIAEGTDVDVRGVVVSGVYTNAVFVQEPGGGQYSGVSVFINAVPTVEVGDEVDIVGTTQEFNGLTEIDAERGQLTHTGRSDIEIIPEVLDFAALSPDLAEPWEAVVVRVEGNPLWVSGLGPNDEFDVRVSGRSGVRVDGLLYDVVGDAASFPDFEVGAHFSAIQGPLNFSADTFKIAPRGPSDLEDYVAPEVATVAELLYGDLVITELMYDPLCDGDDCEWIEVYNASGGDVNLSGLSIEDDNGNSGQIDVDVVVLAEGYAWLGRGNPSTWPYATQPDAYYGGSPGFGNMTGGDCAGLWNGIEFLDFTACYSSQGQSDEGLSWKLRPGQDADQNDVADNWCYSTMSFDAMVTEELGSPGMENEIPCNPAVQP